MRNIRGVTIGLFLLASLPAAPALAVDDRPDADDVAAICKAIENVCEAVCDGKFESTTINWELCRSACDGDERICNGTGGSGIARGLPKKALNQSFQPTERNWARP